MQKRLRLDLYLVRTVASLRISFIGNLILFATNCYLIYIWVVVNGRVRAKGPSRGYILKIHHAGCSCASEKGNLVLDKAGMSSA